MLLLVRAWQDDDDMVEDMTIKTTKTAAIMVTLLFGAMTRRRGDHKFLCCVLKDTVRSASMPQCIVVYIEGQNQIFGIGLSIN